MRPYFAFLAAMVFATPAAAQTFQVESDKGTRLDARPVAAFSEPWAMTFLPGGEMLVTEKPGRLMLVTQEGSKTEVSGVPAVDYGGQGGLGDVVLHPGFADNGLVYLSFAEAGEGDTRGAAVASAKLSRDGGAPRLDDLKVIWRQEPKVPGRGHYSHRIAFSPDGKHLFITSGERQKKTPAQAMDTNLGKVIRLNPDGTVPEGNPFEDSGDLARSFWTIGHRNMLGIDFDTEGRLWVIEMGPRGGDELNLVEAGRNYGWPEVSNGINYNGTDIPDHSTRPEFEAPKAWWTPVIAPAGLVFHDGGMFSDWRGDALTGGLRSQSLVRIAIEGETAREAERFDMGRRIREVEQGPDGAIWLLEDGPDGRLLRLTPREQG